jgi:hypothetical protein
MRHAATDRIDDRPDRPFQRIVITAPLDGLCTTANRPATATARPEPSLVGDGYVVDGHSNTARTSSMSTFISAVRNSAWVIHYPRHSKLSAFQGSANRGPSPVESSNVIPSDAKSGGMCRPLANAGRRG